MSRHRPYAYECDSWKITTSYIGKSLILRRPRFRATATGYRDGKSHAHYLGLLGDEVIGRTRDEAEHKMRELICRDIRAYEEFLRERNYLARTFDAKDVCP